MSLLSALAVAVASQRCNSQIGVGHFQYSLVFILSLYAMRRISTSYLCVEKDHV